MSSRRRTLNADANFPLRNDFLGFKKYVDDLYDSNKISFGERRIYISIFEESMLFAKRLTVFYSYCEGKDIWRDNYLNLFDNSLIKSPQDLDHFLSSSNDIHNPIMKFLKTLVTYFKSDKDPFTTGKISAVMNGNVDIYQKPYFHDLTKSINLYIDGINMMLNEKKTFKTIGERGLYKNIYTLTSEEQRQVENLYLMHLKSIRALLTLKCCDGSLKNKLHQIDERIEALNDKISKNNCWMSIEPDEIEIEFKNLGDLNDNSKQCLDLEKNYVANQTVRSKDCKGMIESISRGMQDRLALNCDKLRLNTMETSNFVEVFDGSSLDKECIVYDQNQNTNSSSDIPQPNIFFVFYIFWLIKNTFKF